MTSDPGEHPCDLRRELIRRAAAHARLEQLATVRDAFARVTSFADLLAAYKQFAAYDKDMALECFNTAMTQWLCHLHQTDRQAYDAAIAAVKRAGAPLVTPTLEDPRRPQVSQPIALEE
jgi:hypothetical protein